MINREKVSSFFLSCLVLKRPKSKQSLTMIIIVHFFAWLLFYSLPFFLYPIELRNSELIYAEICFFCILILLFYINYFFLIPRFFDKRKIVQYFIGLSICIIIVILLHFLLAKYTFDIVIHSQDFSQMLSLQNNLQQQPSIEDLSKSGIPSVGLFLNDSSMSQMNSFSIIKAPPFLANEKLYYGVPLTLYKEFLSRAITNSLIIILLGSFIRLTFSLIKSQNEKKALENANLNAELTFLKSQINPHFLFNTLNSIYSEAHSKSSNTEYSILKLSDMLRYMLYDTRAEKIALEKDIQYISNYIDLQRLRILNKVTINYNIHGEISNLSIAPLLLITYIENAFKHGISYKNSSNINIEIKILDKTLTLHVSNPITNQDNFEDNGIGLKNTKRRLDLLYANGYTLLTSADKTTYTINLKLNLSND
jgi:two-component system, LytTR family, sensor kinase